MPIVKIKRFSDATKVELTTDESIIEVGGGITYLNRSMLIASVKSPQNYNFYEAHSIACKLYESGGKIYAKFNRASTGVYNQVDINFVVTELDSECIVEHKTKVMPKNTSSITDTITTVNRTKAFIIHTVKSNEVDSSIPASNLLVKAKINANNQVTFTRAVSSSAAITIEYQIVYMPDIMSVQNVEGTNTTNPTDNTISFVEQERTLCFLSVATPASITSLKAYDLPQAYLTSSTNLRIEAYSPSNAMSYICQVVHFEFGKVINNNTSVSANALNATVSFGETLDLEKIFEMMPSAANSYGGANTSSENVGHFLWVIKSLTATQCLVERKDNALAPAASIRTAIMQFDRGASGKRYKHYHKMRKPMELRKSTQVILDIGPFIDETDGKTELNSLSLSASDFLITKNGATSIAPTLVGSITADAKGMYKITLAAGDVDTQGTLKLFCHKATALPVWHDFNIVNQAYWDWKYSTGKLDTNVVYVSGNAQDIATQTLLTSTKSVVDGIDTNVDTANSNISTIDNNIVTIVSKLPATSQLMAGATDMGVIDSNVDTIISKLPTNDIADHNDIQTLLSGVNINKVNNVSVTLENIQSLPEDQALQLLTSMKYIKAMSRNRMRVDDDNPAVIHFYDEDSVNILFSVNVTELERLPV